MCAEIVAQKFQSYYTQAEEYHNQCLQGNVLKVSKNNGVIWDEHDW